MAKLKIFLFLLVSASTLFGSIAFGQANKYESTIPSEILRQYDPEIVAGRRPKFVTITQPMIWELRNNPDQGGEVYRLDLVVSRLSTVQKELLQNWVKGGQKVLIWGRREFKLYEDLFPCLGQVYYGKFTSIQRLLDHPVNTDVQKISFSKFSIFTVFKQYPKDSEIIVSIKQGVIAGRAPFGRGAIYFATPEYSADRDRWTLNFYQWLLGLRVPGMAETRIGERPSASSIAKTEAFAQVLLKNGDIIIGELLTGEFSIRTSYALLSFPLNQIESVVFKGINKNIEMIVLRNGDKLSGVVGPDTVKIKTIRGQEIAIEMDNIMKLSIQQAWR